jgi:hypothetical protein
MLVALLVFTVGLIVILAATQTPVSTAVSLTYEGADGVTTESDA